MKSLTAPSQSSKVSGSPIKRLTRKERSRRGQERASDHKQRDKPHVSFSDVTPPSSTHRSTCHSKLSGPDLTLRRQTLLLEDSLDSPHSHRDSVCWWPVITSDQPVSGPRSASEKLPPPSPSSFCGECLFLCGWLLQPKHNFLDHFLFSGNSDSDVLLDLLKPHNAEQILIKIADLGNACWVVSETDEQ